MTALKAVVAAAAMGQAPYPDACPRPPRDEWWRVDIRLGKNVRACYKGEAGRGDGGFLPSCTKPIAGPDDDDKAALRWLSTTRQSSAATSATVCGSQACLLSY